MKQFDQTVETCAAHAKRLRWAQNTLSNQFPLTAENLSNIGDVDLAILDQFIVRFSKLQDAMGAKLFPALLDLTYEQGDLTAFIDKLNRLEKLGAIPSTQQWLLLREMRNQFAHDYPDDPELQASLLNKAYKLSKELLSVFEGTLKFAEKYR